MARANTPQDRGFAAGVGRAVVHDLVGAVVGHGDSSTGLADSSNGDPVDARTNWFVKCGVCALTATATVADEETSQIATIVNGDVASTATGSQKPRPVAACNIGVESCTAMSAPLNSLRAANAKALRKAAGLSQAKLAERAGIRREEYNQMENDRRTITDRSVLKLAAALGVDPEAYLEPPPSVNGHGHA